MKKISSLIVLAIMLSCSSEKTYEDLKKDIPTATSTSINVPAAISTSKIIFGGAVGKINSLNGKISFLKDEKSILKDFNSLLEKGEIDAKLTRVELEEIDGVHYLKGYGKKYQSSMLLVKDETGSLQAYGVTCTTSACSHTTGCTAKPDGTCSACTGDCKKTTNQQ